MSTLIQPSNLADNTYNITANNALHLNGQPAAYYTYTLPAANTTVLGGVKVDGTTIQITDNVISANVANVSYTLLPASTTVLGGVKIDGVTITISSNIISANLTDYVTATNLNNNLSNYQTTAGLSANVAKLTANNSTNLNGQPASYYVYSLPAANTTVLGGVKIDGVTITISSNIISANLTDYVTATNLTDNLSNYQTAAGLSANVAKLTANNTTLLNGQPGSYYIYSLPAANTTVLGGVKVDGTTITISSNIISANLTNYVTATNLTNNLSNYQTTAGLSANVAKLTANNSTNLNGQPASYYVYSLPIANSTALGGVKIDSNTILINATSGVISTNNDSSKIDFLQQGTNAVTRTLQTKLREQAFGISVKDFGAIGNGSADDYSAIANAITAAGTSGTVFFPKGTYKVTSGITMLESQTLMGEGGRRGSTIKKAFNGTLITMGDLSEIFNLNFDCDGNNFTGDGILVPSGYSHTITDVRVTGCQGIPLKFATNGGGGCYVANFEADVITQDNVGIELGDDYPGPVPRFFNGIWLSNSKIDLRDCATGVAINNFYVRGFLTGTSIGGTGSGAFQVSHGRISNATGFTFSKCFDSSLTNVAISPAVTIDDCQGFHITNVTFQSGLTVNDNVRFSEISDLARQYTPTWTQSSGTQPAIGNGSLEGWYQNSGYSTVVSIILTVGSTTTFGNNATAWRFSLPRVASNAFVQRGIPITMILNNVNYVGDGSIGAQEKDITIGYNGQSVRLGWPNNWAAGDVIRMQFTMINY